jgi:hypothetical protein
LFDQLHPDKAHETDNHLLEGFGSHFILLFLFVLASMPVRRVFAYVVPPVGAAGLAGGWHSVGVVVLLAAMCLAEAGAWLMFWTGTKGIHCAWHVITCLAQEVEKGKPVDLTALPPIEAYYALGTHYRRGGFGTAVLIAVGFALIGMWGFALLNLVMFAVMTWLLHMMYRHDLRRDYALLFPKGSH